jgi:ectoine hydroxylase-related dioxygenase (phytanoyl-CoA dioxygenase family)
MDEHGKLGNLNHVYEPLGFHETIEVPVLALPGDSIFFGDYLLHRSGENSCAGSRRAMVMHCSTRRDPLGLEIPD